MICLLVGTPVGVDVTDLSVGWDSSRGGCH